MIELKNICKDYLVGENVIHAVQGIDLKVEVGEFISVAGPSGSGKSTLLNIMGGLDHPTKGEAYIDGTLMSGMSNRELTKIRLQRIGFIFQSFNLIPVFNVFENVEYPLVLRRIPSKERKERVEDILVGVGLSNRLTHYPQMLSGGQHQRVSIARALVGRPEIILADEPTANLDSKTGYEIIELMHELNIKDKVTFIFATHDPKVMERAKRVIQLVDGRIVL